MTKNTAAELIDPNLTAALQQWSEFCKKNAQDNLTLLKWMAPAKDAQQMSEQLTELLKSTDWQTVMKNWTTPGLFWGTLQGAYGELAELQKAGFEASIKGTQQLLEASQQAAAQLSAIQPDTTNPQQTLATWLTTSLEIAEHYQALSGQQAEELSGLNTAGKIWLERTITGQNAPE